jgi:hypothetical protein
MSWNHRGEGTSRRRDIEEKGHVQYREHDKHLYRLSTMNTNRCERQISTPLHSN